MGDSDIIGHFRPKNRTEKDIPEILSAMDQNPRKICIVSDTKESVDLQVQVHIKSSLQLIGLIFSRYTGYTILPLHPMVSPN